MRALRAASFVAAMLAAPAAIPADGPYPTVDVALVLAVDVSASIDEAERAMQRDGYAAAITSPEVLKAIGDGAHGRILVTVIEWSDSFAQEIRVPWTAISGPADAERVAELIRLPGSAIPRSTTSVSGALWKANRLLMDAPERAERQVVDISGDGKDLEITSLQIAREALLATGATINGLPILSAPDDPDVAEYYRSSVIGGPGAFVEPAEGFHEIEPALRRKLVQEIG